MVMKILVVEDNQTVAQTLQYLLSSYNYAVDLASDGEMGLQMAQDFEYDLVVLDILLPQLDGVTLCQRLREEGFQTPILLLTGRGGGGHQKATALNAGADDYVVKPFDAEELIARVQALLRRGGPRTQPILRWGDLSIDPSRREVMYGTYILSTTPKEYAILELFLRYDHRVFSARNILDQAWSSLESPGDEAVRVHIKELRKKLKEAGAPGDLIKTVYRAGYRLNPLYADGTIAAADTQLTPAEIAELRAKNDELRHMVTTLQATQTDLQQQHTALEAAYRTLEQECQYLQSVQAAPTVSMANHGPLRGYAPLNAIERSPLTVAATTPVLDAISRMSDSLSPPTYGVGDDPTDVLAPPQLAASVARSCILVTEGERLLGILTERDVGRLLSQYQSLADLAVQQVMSHPVITLREDALTHVAVAINLLRQHQIRHLPILDDHDCLMGLVTYESLWQAFDAPGQTGVDDSS